MFLGLSIFLTGLRSGFSCWSLSVLWSRVSAELWSSLWMTIALRIYKNVSKNPFLRSPYTHPIRIIGIAFMRKMRLAFTRYIPFFQPWLCVIVYLWLLELQAAFGTDAEPLLDRLADTSAILWTLMVWTGGLSMGVFLLSNLFGASIVSRVNHFACNTALILITAFHFVLWLHKLKPGMEVSLILILASCAVFSAWALKRRGPNPGETATGRCRVWTLVSISSRFP